MNMIPNSFTSYELSDREKLESGVFTEIQKRFLQNELSTIAHQILNLDADPEHVLEFIKQKMFLQGQLSSFQFLLDSSSAKEEVLRQLALAQANS